MWGPSSALLGNDRTKEKIQSTRLGLGWARNAGIPGSGLQCELRTPFLFFSWTEQRLSKHPSPLWAQGAHSLFFSPCATPHTTCDTGDATSTAEGLSTPHPTLRWCSAPPSYEQVNRLQEALVWPSAAGPPVETRPLLQLTTNCKKSIPTTRTVNSILSQTCDLKVNTMDSPLIQDRSPGLQAPPQAASSTPSSIWQRKKLRHRKVTLW